MWISLSRRGNDVWTNCMCSSYKLLSNLQCVCLHLAELIANGMYTSEGYLPFPPSIVVVPLCKQKKRKKKLSSSSRTLCSCSKCFEINRCQLVSISFPCICVRLLVGVLDLQLHSLGHNILSPIKVISHKNRLLYNHQINSKCDYRSTN